MWYCVHVESLIHIDYVDYGGDIVLCVHTEPYSLTQLSLGGVNEWYAEVAHTSPFEPNSSFSENAIISHYTTGHQKSDILRTLALDKLVNYMNQDFPCIL